MTSGRSAVLVVTPRSRRGSRLLDGAQDRSARAGLRLVGLRRVEGDLRAVVDAATENGPDVVVPRASASERSG